MIQGWDELELEGRLEGLDVVETLGRDNLVAIARIFHPNADWVWYIVGGDVDPDNGDIDFYGMVFSPYDPGGQMGYFSLSQLEEMPLKVDSKFKPTPIPDVKKG